MKNFPSVQVNTKEVMGVIGDIHARILRLGPRWRWVVN